MDRVYDKCCGIDVHKKLIVACFKQGNRQEIRDFGATTRELLEMADWLKKGGCEMIAMESTSSYWKPLYNILESSDLKVNISILWVKQIPHPEIHYETTQHHPAISPAVRYSEKSSPLPESSSGKSPERSQIPHSHSPRRTEWKSR